MNAFASRLSLALDPVRFARAAGVEPDAWQARSLRSTARQILMLCSRQSATSTTSGLLALDEAIHRPPALGLILVPALRQAQETFLKIKAALAELGTSPRRSRRSQRSRSSSRPGHALSVCRYGRPS